MSRASGAGLQEGLAMRAINTGEYTRVTLTTARRMHAAGRAVAVIVAGWGMPDRDDELEGAGDVRAFDQAVDGLRFSPCGGNGETRLQYFVR